MKETYYVAETIGKQCDNGRITAKTKSELLRKIRKINNSKGSAITVLSSSIKKVTRDR